MANPPQPPRGYSYVPSQPDASSPNPDKSSVLSPPPVSPIPARFPPTNIASPSIQTPAMLSPANGIKNGSPTPHLSTPPGPPVFTSPVRPAAVPFRTSPATPQPVAFSSGSSLPASSPPHFSNGSVQLDNQLSHSTEEPLSVGELPVFFSAHKVYLIDWN